MAELLTCKVLEGFIELFKEAHKEVNDLNKIYKDPEEESLLVESALYKICLSIASKLSVKSVERIFNLRCKNPQDLEKSDLKAAYEEKL